jgi:hypothetical protein
MDQVVVMPYVPYLQVRHRSVDNGMAENPGVVDAERSCPIHTLLVGYFTAEGHVSLQQAASLAASLYYHR